MASDYLPGINVVLNDLGLKVAPPPAGPKVTLLGVTSNAAITALEPYTVSSVEKAVNALYFDLSGTNIPGGLAGQTGRIPGELSLAIEEASAAGAENIEVMVIGHYSGLTLQDYIRADTDPVTRYTDLSGAYDILRNADVDVVTPVGAYIDAVFTGTAASSYSFGKQLADFCFQSTTNSSAVHGVISVAPPLEWATFHRTGLAINSSTLSGELVSFFGEAATTGAFSTDAELATQLNVTNFSTPSTALVNAWQDYHVNDNMYSLAMNTSYNYWMYGAYDQDANKLSAVTDAGASSVHTNYFIGWQATSAAGTAATDSRGVRIDAGGYISVFTAPLRAAGTQVKTLALGLGASPANTSKNTSGGVAYAGKILSLAPQSSTTNKPVGGLTQLRLLSASQANELVGMRHVTMYRRTRGLVVASGITGAHNVTKYVRSDYTRLTTVRIVSAVVDLIRAIGDKYIGEPNNAPQINSLDSEIDQLLLQMKGQGALNGYDFSISATPDERVLGTLNVNLTLVPAFEITDINLTVSLTKEL